MFLNSLFQSSTPAAAATTPATTTPPAAGATTPDATTPGTNQPASAVGSASKPDGTPANPLDVYKDMYNNMNKDTELKAPSFRLDPEVVSKVTSGLDFTKGVAPELMTKAMAGDAKSLIDLVQEVGRNAYRASLEHTTTLTDTHLGQRLDFENKRLDQGVKSQLTSQALASVPNYNHPVLKAELNRIAAQFARSNPDASPQAIAEAAQKYMVDLAAATSGTASGNPTDANQSTEMDWTAYLTKK